MCVKASKNEMICDLEFIMMVAIKIKTKMTIMKMCRILTKKKSQD